MASRLPLATPPPETRWLSPRVPGGRHRHGEARRGTCWTSCCINSKRLQTDWKIRRHFKGAMTGGDGGGSVEVASPDGQP